MRCAWLLVVRLAPALPCLALLGVATAAVADPPAAPGSTIELRLPADIVYSGAPGAENPVVFSHQSHVAFADNRCSGCHPGTFPMLRRGPAPTHELMNAKGSCGVCHNGKEAFDVQDGAMCSTCHAPAPAAAAGTPTPASQPARKLPAPHTYPASPNSIGKVTFRHATHLTGDQGCSPCHPQPFRMAASPPLVDGGMHEAGACGACHDGQKAFAATDDTACSRCHAETGAQP